MRAVRYHSFGGDPQVDEVPAPTAGGREVVVRVERCQIGGDVLKIMAGTGPVRDVQSFAFPHTPGYRGAGVVEAVGEAVQRVAVGDRVMVNGFVNCGSCEYCWRGLDNLCPHSVMLGLDSGQPGALAELFKAPEWAVFQLPDEMPFDRATLLPNAALLVHAYKRAGVSEGFSTAIFGAGLVGSGAIAVARALGASQIVAVDREPAALEFARTCGATAVVDSGAEDPVEVVRERTGGKGVDVAVEIVGVAETVRQAVLSTRWHGVTLLIGALQGLDLEFPDYYHEVIQREVDLKACFGKTQADFAEAVELAASGRLDLSAYSLESHPVSEFGAAVAAAADPSNRDLHLMSMQER